MRQYVIFGQNQQHFWMCMMRSEETGRSDINFRHSEITQKIHGNGKKISHQFHGFLCYAMKHDKPMKMGFCESGNNVAKWLLHFSFSSLLFVLMLHSVVLIVNIYIYSIFHYIFWTLFQSEAIAEEKF